MNSVARSKIMLRLRTGALWIGAAQVVQMLSGFLILTILTKNLSISAFGYYSFCITIVMFARQVLFDPVSVILAKNSGTLKNVDESTPKVLWVLKYLTDRAFLILACLGMFLFFYFKGDSLSLGVLALSCFIYLSVHGAFGVYLNVLNTIRERKTASLFLMADTLGKLSAIIFAAYIFKDRLDYIFLAIALSGIISVICLRSFTSRKFKVYMVTSQQLHRDVKSSVEDSLPLIVPSFFMALKMYGDRWILAAFMGVEELAGFSVLHQLGYVPMILTLGVVQTYVVPTIYNLGELKNSTSLLIYLKAIVFKVLIIALAIAIVSIPLSGWIFGLMVGENYQEYSYYLSMFVISGATTAISAILYVALIACFSTPRVAKMATTAVLISLVSTSFLVALLGFLGAVVGLTCSSIATMCFYWYLICSRSK